MFLCFFFPMFLSKIKFLSSSLPFSWIHMSQSTFSSYHVAIYTDQWHRWSGSEPRWREFGADAPLSETCERFNPLVRIRCRFLLLCFDHFFIFVHFIFLRKSLRTVKCCCILRSTPKWMLTLRCDSKKGKAAARKNVFVHTRLLLCWRAFLW